ncbi:MAG: hypothetical protein A2161_21480 [Candidatus Schekmanbacteria bacterium RBG_13_48_7]|uniref:Uncharacterized protein n=1 Tax=Candidatus Schekmanbacteria bacterium RBG_13_48_7 TaxID=1817878 RepID=A0A1F7RQ24_9BACT|nr:MAG: hypothetical protein A2161_21480 [Candidatus Schekmanbacteria bacterium RBG_13_48_7]
MFFLFFYPLYFHSYILNIYFVSIRINPLILSIIIFRNMIRRFLQSDRLTGNNKNFEYSEKSEEYKRWWKNMITFRI